MTTSIAPRIETYPDEASWLERKRTLISASEIASLTSYGKFKDSSPLGLYLRKLKPREDNADLARGRDLEPFVRAAYRKRNPALRPANLPPFTIYIHPEIDWLSCTPDDLFVDASGQPYTGGEYKTDRSKDGWGDPKEEPDGVHVAYLPQVTVCMACVVVPTWGVGAVVGSLDDYREYLVSRSPKVERAWIDLAEKFRRDHLLPQIPPPFDGSDAGDELLKFLYPNVMKPMLQVAPDSELHARMVTLHALRMERLALEAQEETIAQQIKDEIGDAEGIVGEGFRATWRKSADGVRMRGYKDLLKEGHAPAELAPFAHTIAGTRSFKPKWDGDREEVF